MTPPAGIHVTAPCRIDLAGGTLDVYPLYLFEGGGVTVNAAISILSNVHIAPREDSAILLRSEDLATEAQYADVESVALDGPLELLARAVRHYAPPCGVTITVRNDAPQGSGLGASSALLMALSVGLSRLRGDTPAVTDLIDVGANLEAQVIGIPTGKQDYYPALCGGVAALEFGVQGHRREDLCPSAAARDAISSRLVLSFTGISRVSAASNWAVLQNYVDGEPRTKEALGRIARTARRMRTCLANEAWDELPGLLAEEWANRRDLADGVSTPRVEELMAAAAAAGADASKLCGAGGGGCMLTYTAPERRAAVEAALRDAGAEVLPYRIVETGAEVRQLAGSV